MACFLRTDSGTLGAMVVMIVEVKKVMESVAGGWGLGMNASAKQTGGRLNNQQSKRGLERLGFSHTIPT